MNAGLVLPVQEAGWHHRATFRWMSLVRHRPQPVPSFREALVSQFISNKRSVLRSSLVGIALRESGTPIFALYGFPTLGSIHRASPTPSSLVSCYTTIATSPSPMQAVFHSVGKETEISIRRSSRVALQGLIGAASDQVLRSSSHLLHNMLRLLRRSRRC
jgi:hypothetical protein